VEVHEEHGASAEQQQAGLSTTIWGGGGYIFFFKFDYVLEKTHDAIARSKDLYYY